MPYLDFLGVLPTENQRHTEAEERQDNRGKLSGRVISTEQMYHYICIQSTFGYPREYFTCLTVKPLRSCAMQKMNQEYHFLSRPPDGQRWFLSVRDGMRLCVCTSVRDCMQCVCVRACERWYDVLVRVGDGIPCVWEFN